MFHFLWLACVPCSIWLLVSACISRRSPGARYVGSLVCLLLMAAMAPVAFLVTDGLSSDGAAGESGSSSTAMLTYADESSSTSVASSSVAGQVSGQIDVSQAEKLQQAEGETKSGKTIPTGGKLLRAGNERSRLDALLETWSPALLSCYFIGLAFFVVRMLYSVLVTRRLRNESQQLNGSRHDALVARVTREVGLKAEPAVRWCSETAVPTVVGVLKPAVLLPLSWASEVPAQQLEQVLWHELTHLRRRDHLVNCLQNTIETVLFFHPLIWIISGQVRLHRELSCDDAVVGAGADRYDYATMLIDVAQRNFGSGTPVVAGVSVVAGVPVTAGRSQLRSRIESLLGKRPARHRWIDATSVVAILAFVGLLVGVSFAQEAAKDKQADEPKAKTVDEKLADIQPRELAGIVQDEDGKPLAGVTVDAWSWHPGDEVTTDRDGVFRFKPEIDSTRSRPEIRYSKDGYSPHYVVQHELGGKDLVITLNRDTFIEGVVLDPDGKPVGDTVVRGEQGPQRGDGVMIGSVPTETKTDEEGRYRLYVHPDTYTLFVSTKQGVARMDGIEAKARKGLDQDLQLKPGVRFQANVVNSETGKPFQGLVLFNWRNKGVLGVSDADGRLVIEGLFPGEFEFNVGHGELKKQHGMEYYEHGDLGRWWSPDALHSHQRLVVDTEHFQRNFDGLTFDLSVGMEPVTIEVEEGVVFAGHVYDPDGKPVAGATVAPAKTGSGNSLTGDTRYSVETEEDGSYRVVMPAGNDFQYNLTAHDGKYGEWRNWANGITEPIESEPGQIFMDIDVYLTRGATVKGKINLPEGDKTKRQVRAHGADKFGNRYYDPTIDLVADDGTFELKFIRPGKHFIRVSPFWMQAEDAAHGSTIVELKEGEVREGIELTPAPRNE